MAYWWGKAGSPGGGANNTPEHGPRERFPVAKKSITQDLHGTKWKVHQDLADSLGLRFAQEYFSGYDWSQVEWVTVKVGEWVIPTGGLDE